MRWLAQAMRKSMGPVKRKRSWAHWLSSRVRSVLRDPEAGNAACGVVAAEDAGVGEAVKKRMRKAMVTGSQAQ
jgi:hypothetical protein